MSKYVQPRDPSVLPTMQVTHPEAKVVQGPASLENVDFVLDQALLLCDLNDTWWHRVWSMSTPDILMTVEHFSRRPTDPCVLRCVAMPSRLRLEDSAFRQAIRIWRTSAYLANSELSLPGVDAVSVEVQVCARAIWIGELSHHFDLRKLQLHWQESSRSLHLLQGLRIFSGPFPQAHSCSLGKIFADPKKHVVVSLNYCSQNGGNLYRAPYYTGNPNIGPCIMGILDQSPCSFLREAARVSHA